MESGSFEQNRPLDPSQILSAEPLSVMVLAAGQPWPKADGHWLCREGITHYQRIFLLRSWMHSLGGENDRQSLQLPQVLHRPIHCEDPLVHPL